jgi:hypothetical protein
MNKIQVVFCLQDPAPLPTREVVHFKYIGAKLLVSFALKNNILLFPLKVYLNW